MFGLITTKIANPKNEKANFDGLFTPEIASNVPTMLRTLAVC